ncbi:MAG TPA: hypothetical protein VFB72_01890 [Verrucomicrobiae bacterium]|nr:hypothetical protein [Verrucomicrobiae bacterium]
MKITLTPAKRWENGSAAIFLYLTIIVVWAIAAVAVYITSTSKMATSRVNLTAAVNYADAGVVIAAADLRTAYTNTAQTFTQNLVSGTNNAYTQLTNANASNMLVFQRTISLPFTNQTVTAQIIITNSTAPQTAQVSASATVGNVTQTAVANLEMKFGQGAAIISVNAGTTGTGTDKATAQAGNVVVNGVGSGSYLIVDGGAGGLAVMANGRVNVSAGSSVSSSGVSMTNWGSANAVPDYTSQGTANSLFDFNRFIAAANAGAGHEYTNMTDFINAAKTGAVLEGISVVDLHTTDKDLGDLTAANLPNGVNIRGTLLFNFAGSGWTPTTKFVVNAAININAANLSHLVPGTSSTYATGYPPTYTDSTKNPINVSISPTYPNFQQGDDLPALLYSIGEVDMHGPVNVCGVVYTPSYIELENKANNQTQYIRGVVIMGNGMYFENTSSDSTSIISYDQGTLKNLTTSNNVGKSLFVTYWQQ